MTTVGCTGHRTLSPVSVGWVATELRRLLEVPSRQEDLVGVCSLAIGADQVFASVVLELSGRLRAVIPAAGYETTFAPDDRRSYEALLAAASAVETLPYPAPSPAAYLAAGRRVVELADVLLAVWDGREARGPGGTADVVAMARDLGVPVTVVWPTTGAKST